MRVTGVGSPAGELVPLIALLGFLAFTRTLYRMFDSPWTIAGTAPGDRI